ncbi:hypothetical protein [Dermatobacter hominis]|uniref:hypothetical protein n=1 Tax=Dermatobacter hominis TaxID=2884263 RepID=UPI001D12AF05|nr:hypothetical protein [Dermatobacter hominis]UDY37062.1 hypothetical protein LH044_05875 [Dermatobacter hominis]
MTDRPVQHRTLVRVLLAVLLASGLVLGIWAAFFPLGFYESFPGFGRHWVSADGPYNQHLVRDVGNLFLALSVVTGVALAAATSMLVRATAAAWTVFSLLHFAYHLRHLDVYDGVDAAGNVVSLGSMLVVAVVLLLVAGPSAADTDRAATATGTDAPAT